MNYWLMKSEPNVYSIEDLEQGLEEDWDGVRNYQARNIMRDDMKVGDLALFYHSNAKPPGVAGICRICKTEIADYTAWDPTSNYYDPKSSKEDPIWIMVRVAFVEKFPRVVSLNELKANEALSEVMVVQKGSRLSVQPVSKKHFQIIKKMAYSL